MSGAPESPLVLVPTPLESARLERLGGLGAGWECCGFGPIAAAARTAQLLATRRPPWVLLLGIAGSYDPELAPEGTALEFSRVALEGVGVGGRAPCTPGSRLGFPQWPGAPGLARGAPEAGLRGAPGISGIPGATGSTGPTEVLGEELDLRPEPGPLLLSVCAASADREEAALRRRGWPGAVAEDMEGFGVALACRLAGVPLRIVRGLSNAVGERDGARWRVEEALEAARRLALSILGARGPGAGA